MKIKNITVINWKLVVSIALIATLFNCSNDKDVEPKFANVDILTMTPASPATLKYYKTDSNDRVIIKYNYEINDKDGVQIWIKAISSGVWKGTLYYSPSPVYTGKGTIEAFISAVSDESSIVVDQVNIIIQSAGTSKKRSEKLMDVDYTFGK